MEKNLLKQNKESWDAIADSFFGVTALPVYGCFIPTEDELGLFPELENKKVLDIGCGRGEFLEVMKSNGIPAVGVDMYEPFVKFNKEIGLDARLEDGITHLMNLADDSVGGVFMSHVVEHLNSDYILKLIPLAYQKMEKGAYFILQTPNPESLFTFIDFYIDIEHRKPVHFKTLEFFFKQAGFSEVKRFDPPETKFKEVVTYIDGENLKNVQAFNNGMGNLNQYLTGYQDYVLIAKK